MKKLLLLGQNSNQRHNHDNIHHQNNHEIPLQNNNE